MSAELEEALRRARAQVETMTPEQRDEMIREQARSWARAEASWPKPRYEWRDGVKVYASYEDYCND